MFTTQLGVFSFFLLCCCNKSQAKLYLKSRTSMALAGKAVIHELEVTIPANGTVHNIKCYLNSHPVWEEALMFETLPYPQQRDLLANIIMSNSSCSGEYYFEYINEKVYWVVLVRDVGYQPDAEGFAVPLLVAIIVALLLLSVTGSVYIYKWCKNHSSSEGNEDKVKVKRKKRNTVVTKEGALSDPVYTALEQRTVSVYDVINVDKARRASAESLKSKKKAQPSPVEEGILESVYENM